MNSRTPRLPAPLGTVLSRLPAWPGSVLFVTGLNAFLVRHLPADVRDALCDRSLRIRVTDANIDVDFTYSGHTFRAARHQHDVDLTIAASTYDFLCLMQREEDPDTLFFSRRLVMEGDTELGLMVKNALDALDMSTPAIRHFMPVINIVSHVLR